MTINNALRRLKLPPRAPKTEAQPEPIAVGELESHVFYCPRCTRPLATGTLACPGCGTHLIFGVRARLASAFLVVGLAAGLLVGGGVMSVTRPSAADGTAVVPDRATPGSGAASASPAPFLPSEVGIPSKAVSSIRQAAILNARLAAQGAQLRALLKNSNARGADIAGILRTINSDANVGVAIAPNIAPWTEATKLSEDLGAAYAASRDWAESSLRVTVTNARAYRTAGKRMLVLLSRLPTLDARAATLIGDAGLAPLFEPKPVPSAAP